MGENRANEIIIPSKFNVHVLINTCSMKKVQYLM